MAVSSEQEGRESGRTRRATKRMLGAGIGGEAVLTPIPQWGLCLHIGAHRGALIPYRRTMVADGYTPFEGNIRLDRVQFGASLAFD